MADRAAFRARVTALEREIPEADRLSGDRLLRERFLTLPQLAEADTVLLFSGMDREVDTSPLLDELFRRNRRVLLPRCLPNHGMEARLFDPQKLVRHPFGMWEPDLDCPVVPPEEIDLVLVPALCYDRSRHRMGRGGGYYDRWLSGFRGFSVGLCRDRLLFDCIPRAPWDVPVRLVLTETQKF